MYTPFDCGDTASNAILSIYSFTYIIAFLADAVRLLQDNIEQYRNGRAFKGHLGDI